jgi:7,8-dihydropterin-6-yl-methyl-4-(beta-D-ribofuranosyl)aminobenzene 5'-phosphate synthase
MKRYLCCVCAMTLLLVACTAPPAPLTAPAPPTAPAAALVFPSGTFDLKPYEGVFLGAQVPKKLAYTFQDDGTYTVTGNGFAMGSGTATVNGNQISLEGKFLDGTCPEAGQYSWSFDGTSLNFNAIQDPCADRKAGFAAAMTRRAETAAASVAITKLQNLGTTKSLTILPLDEVAGRDSFKTEQRAVSYLIKTDAATILFDVGANSKNEDPSPLLANMEQLGVKLSDIDAIAISHEHFDHTGGFKWQFTDTFSLGNQQVDLGNKRVYVPKPMTYPGLTPTVVNQPVAIAPGVASIGTLPMTPPGFGNEQVLAVNVEGKGIVLITGCGHPTVPKIVERAKMVFDEPIVGLVGGLHYPEKDSKLLQPRVDYIKGLNLQLVAVSPHDSSQEAIAAIQQVTPAAFEPIQVGQPIAFGL